MGKFLWQSVCRRDWRQLRHWLYQRLRRHLDWADRHLPFGVRTAAGGLLAVGGVFGFLPILGFWMLPLGFLLIALDVPPLRRRVRRWFDLPREPQSEE